MSKTKLFFIITLVVILSVVLVGCGVPDLDYLFGEGCCFSGLLPLPLALVCYKLFGK